MSAFTDTTTTALASTPTPTDGPRRAVLDALKRDGRNILRRRRRGA